jgi:multidrug efflux system membrane fusion protein
MKNVAFHSALIALLCFSCAKSEKKFTRPPPPVQVTKPLIKTVPLYIETVGHIEAYNQIDVRSQVTGVITSLDFEEGSYVNEGDLLVTIDDRPYVAALHRAKAELARSKAQLKYNKDTATRNTPLVKEEYISQNTYEELVTKVYESEAEVKANRAEVETAKVNLSYCTIPAPVSGVVSDRMIDVGNLVIANDPTTITTVNQIMPIYTTFYVIEKDLPKIRRLQNQSPLAVKASHLDDFKDSREGILTFINNQVDQSTGMIKLKGTFTNEDKFLWPGEYVNVRLILSMQEAAVLLPSEAINLSQKGKYVFVINQDNRAEIRYVEVGQREGDYVIINSGVQKDELVVTSGQINLYNKAKVQISKE